MEFLKKYYHVLTALFVFIVYLFTIAPGVIQIDSGELAAVQAALGIAHPTGYPLFTITGYLFSLIPLPISDIYQLNLFAALLCTGGVFIFILTARLLIDNQEAFQPEKKVIKKKAAKKDRKKAGVNIPAPHEITETPTLKKIAAVVAGGLILAFGKTFWFQSTSVEVYSLHIFLVLLAVHFLIKAYIKKDNDLSAWLIFAVVLAFGFSNHMTMLLILPGTAYLFFVKNGVNKSSLKKLGLMLLVFFPVLILLYSYLPIRASQNPVINWGSPIDMERIFRHISGKQYQVWLFSSADAAKKQFVYFFNSLPLEFNICLFICLFGIISAYIDAKKAFIFLLITFASAVLYSINYDIVDIDSYFLLAYIMLSFFAVYGTIKLFALLRFKKYTYSVSAFLVGLFIALQVFFNIGNVNQSGTYTFEDYTKAILTSTEKGSMIFSYQWDYFISPSYYFQNVEGFRKDAAIVDKELLRRSWYYNQLQTAHPNLLRGVENEVSAFKNAVAPFERDEPFDANVIELSYRSLMTNLVKANLERGNVYVAPELFEKEMQAGEFSLPQGYTLVPDLLLFKVVKNDNKYTPAANPDFTIRFPVKMNHYTTFIQNMAASMLVRRAIYEMQFDKRDRAEVYIQKIKKDFPNYIIPPGIADVMKN